MKNKTPKEIEEFAEKAIPILKEHGFMKAQTSLIWVSVVIFLGVALLIGFIYVANAGLFKSDINQDVTLEPNVTVDNDYAFQPETVNNNDYKFEMPEISIELSENLCACDCG